MLGKYVSAAVLLALVLTATACGGRKIPNTVAETETVSSRYAVINETLDWNAAKAACEAQGGHLVTITSGTEQYQILSLLASIDDSEKRNSYFLGGLDSGKNGDYKWVTGENFDFTNWKLNEPKPVMGEQYLSILAKTYDGNSGTTEPGRWNDTMVNGTAYDGAGDSGFFAPEQMGYIIEWDK
jgi:hypothetical protein